MRQRYALDSNLLLLYLAGLSSRQDVERVRRLRAYSASDYDLLVSIVGSPSRIVLTPNTITETSNLLRSGPVSPVTSRVVAVMKTMLEKLGETYKTSAEALNRPEVDRLGVTDVVMMLVAQSGAVLVTADFDLHAHAIRAGLRAINFNHFRDDASYR